MTVLLLKIVDVINDVIISQNILVQEAIFIRSVDPIVRGDDRYQLPIGTIVRRGAVKFMTVTQHIDGPIGGGNGRWIVAVSVVDSR